MKFPISALVLSSILGGPASAQLLWSDNFNAPDSGSFDAAVLSGRLSGSLAAETYLRSFGAQQQINNNQLLLPIETNGVRWENALNDPIVVGAADRYNWAGGLTPGQAITSAGGFVVNFDWIPIDNTDTNWISFQVGTVNADNGNLTDDDYGILFRNNGGTERFDNTVNLGAGTSFTAAAGGITRQVQITYFFSSFADGASVNAISLVNGVQVANDTFTWDTNGGEMRMELGHSAPNTRVDNLSIATIPEPSSLALVGMGLAGLGLRRRR